MCVGNSSYMGIVEACYSSGPNTCLWGPICVSGTSSWTRTHAVAACTQLGLNSSGIYTSVIHLTSSLDLSSYFYRCDGKSTTSDGYVVYLVCIAVPESERCETGDVCLVNGPRMAGRLEVCFNGLWGTVCKWQQWSRLHASVVCRELGFNSSASEISLEYLVSCTLILAPLTQYLLG